MLFRPIYGLRGLPIPYTQAHTTLVTCAPCAASVYSLFIIQFSDFDFYFLFVSTLCTRRTYNVMPLKLKLISFGARGCHSARVCLCFVCMGCLVAADPLYQIIILATTYTSRGAAQVGTGQLWYTLDTTAKQKKHTTSF